MFASIKSINQIGTDFTINSPYRLALTRFVIWQDLFYDKQVVSAICSKSENIKLQQVWFSQTWCNLMRSTDLLQIARTDLSRLVIHKLDASCFNNLQQVSKYQVAASLIFATCISIDAFNRLAASCSIRLVKTCYPQACCKLLQQLAASLQISSCSKADFHRLAATWWSQQTCCNLLTTCSKPVKSATCSKSVAFLAVYLKCVHIVYIYSITLQKRSIFSKNCE